MAVMSGAVGCYLHVSCTGCSGHHSTSQSLILDNWKSDRGLSHGLSADTMRLSDDMVRVFCQNLSVSRHTELQSLEVRILLKHRTRIRGFTFNLMKISLHSESRVCPKGMFVADWFGEATTNTSSFTPFRGAYMHFIWQLIDIDSNKLIATAAKMESIMAEFTSELYAYPNLSSDPRPGEPQLRDLIV